MRATRNTAWVLGRAGWGAILILSSLHATWLCYHVAARFELSAAADASAEAACLPRVTRHHIEAVAFDCFDWSGIATDPRVVANMLRVTHNGSPLVRATRPRAGDVIEVTLDVPADHLMPPWLAAFGSCFGQRQLTAVATRSL